mmetsp:Transcript_34197/g.80646  ORF Transcript_34197/g.80646 Transcript_34197/m.80646 type:complete len:250 (+) Transcript_34197:192-941(+)
MLPPGTDGNADESTTRNPLAWRTRNLLSSTASGSSSPPILAVQLWCHCVWAVCIMKHSQKESGAALRLAGGHLQGEPGHLSQSTSIETLPSVNSSIAGECSSARTVLMPATSVAMSVGSSKKLRSTLGGCVGSAERRATLPLDLGWIKLSTIVIPCSSSLQSSNSTCCCSSMPCSLHTSFMPGPGPKTACTSGRSAPSFVFKNAKTSPGPCANGPSPRSSRFSTFASDAVSRLRIEIGFETASLSRIHG